MSIKNTQLKGWLWLMTISVFCIPMAVNAATLTVGDIEINAGDTNAIVSVYLAINSGEEIASLQFDLLYDEDQLNFVSAFLDRTVEQDLDKILEYNIISDGLVRFVIYGQNRLIFTEGNILEITFDADADAPEGKSDISFQNFIAASPDALSITLSAEKGIVDVLKDGSTVSSTDDSGGGGGGGGSGCFINTISFRH